jgi:hypothetical protein
MQRLTVPRKVTIEGTTYNLCGDFGPLVEAEAYCGFNLADVLFTWGQDSESILNGARKLLPCALHHFHPEVSYEDVQGMLDRAVAADDPAILHALWHMWPAKTAQTQAANLNLLCDLEALAEANEFLEGKPNLLSICIGEVGFNLDHIWRLWPCAVHHFRPELSLDEGTPAVDARRRAPGHRPTRHRGTRQLRRRQGIGLPSAQPRLRRSKTSRMSFSAWRRKGGGLVTITRI